MNTLIQLAILGFISCCYSASAATLTGTYYGCKSDDLAANLTAYRVEALQYPMSNHVRWALTVNVSQPTNNASVTVCFDAPQCVTAAYYAESYPDTGAGVHCTTIVDMNMVSRSAGDTVNLVFHTYSATPVKIASITFNGNGVVQKNQLPRASPSVANDFCTSCDGGYAGDALSCGSFYHCSNGQAYKMPCPSGLYFNAALGVCDWQPKAGCGISSPPMNGVRHVQCPSSSDCSVAGGLPRYSDAILFSSCTR